MPPSGSPDLRRLLAERDLVISAGKTSGLWSGAPASMKLEDLDMICAVFWNRARLSVWSSQSAWTCTRASWSGWRAHGVGREAVLSRWRYHRYIDCLLTSARSTRRAGGGRGPRGESAIWEATAGVLTVNEAVPEPCASPSPDVECLT